MPNLQSSLSYIHENLKKIDWFTLAPPSYWQHLLKKPNPDDNLNKLNYGIIILSILTNIVTIPLDLVILAYTSFSYCCKWFYAFIKEVFHV